MLRLRHAIPLAALVLFATVSPALAGPPLLCHPFDIGDARSLPWDGGWSEGRRDYNVASLVADTEAILAPATPVIVRMETLRRAALYASRDATVATRLLAMVNDRAAPPSAPARHRRWRCSMQDTWPPPISRSRAPWRWRPRRPRHTIARVIGRGNGMSLIDRTVAMRPDDGAIRFAAALVAAGTDKSAYSQHAAKAREAAGRDPLLANNIKQLS